jgi:hypothetical protein
VPLCVASYEYKSDALTAHTHCRLLLLSFAQDFAKVYLVPPNAGLYNTAVAAVVLTGMPRGLKLKCKRSKPKAFKTTPTIIQVPLVLTSLLNRTSSINALTVSVAGCSKYACVVAAVHDRAALSSISDTTAAQTQ